MATYNMAVRCPQCSSMEASEAGDTRTDKSEIFCPVCGHWRLIDSLSREVIEQRHGHGAYHHVYRRGYGVLGGYKQQQTLKVRKSRLRRLLASPRCRFIEITCRVRGKWKAVVLKNEPQPWQPKRAVQVFEGPEMLIPW